MSVGVFCNREVIVTDRGSTIVEVAKLMRQHHVGDVVIVDHKDGKNIPVGIITDRDIVVGLLAGEVDLDSVTVGDVMSYEVVTASEKESICSTLQNMRKKGIKRMPVVNDQGGLEGILSADDLLGVFAEELADLAKIPEGEMLREKSRRL